MRREHNIHSEIKLTQIARKAPQLSGLTWGLHRCVCAAGSVHLEYAQSRRSEHKKPDRQGKHPTDGLARRRLVEMAGIEPASEEKTTKAPTCVVCLSTLVSLDPTDRTLANLPR